MHRTFEIDIEKLVYGGSGLGRCRGKVVFVPFAAPGDRLLVEPVREKKDYVQARICRVLAPGQGRTDPPCPHFGSCGGCQARHMAYAESLRIATEYSGQIMIDTIRCGISGVFETKGANGRYLIDGLHPNENGARKIGYYNAAKVMPHLGDAFALRG